MEQLPDGGDKWWSSVPFTASKTKNLGGVAQQGLGGGCVKMGARREVVLSAAVVAPTAGLARSMRQYIL